jgi:hypothetical protein
VSIAFLTPFTAAEAALSNGGTWRKRLLPVGEISYKGRTLKFTRDYLAGLVKSFRDGAYDQVPFQLADAGNTHTNDPERTRGLITDMVLQPDGLWIELDATDRGGDVIRANPGLGVSARIVEGYDRSDGKFFPRAIQHVLGTLDPRIPGMGGWQAVEAANDAEVTYDLSGEHFTKEEGGMPELTEDQQTRLAALLNLDPDKLAALAATVDPDVAGALAGDEEEPGGLDEILAEIDQMSDEELAALEAEMEAEEAAEAGAEPEAEPAMAGLSNEAAMAVELAQATGDENARQLGIIAAQLDHERWVNERTKLVDAGTPPFIADLAAPLLEGGGHVVDLANGKSVDAGQIMRRVLTEYAKLGQQLGIGVELGSPMDEPADTEAEAEREDIVKRARAQLFGIRG